MTVYKHLRDDSYTVLTNRIARSKDLPSKERGILTTLMSLPPTWKFTLHGLHSIIPADGMDALRSGINALAEKGYLRRERRRDDRGRWTTVRWDVTDVPFLFCEDGESGVEADPKGTENPMLDNPILDIPEQGVLVIDENVATTRKTGDDPQSDDTTDTSNPILENPTLDDPTLINIDITNTHTHNARVQRAAYADAPAAPDQLADARRPEAQSALVASTPSDDVGSASAAPDAPTSTPRSKSRKRQIDASWHPSASHRALAAKHGVDCDEEAAAFRDYCLANDKRYANHDAAFSNWLRNADKYSASRASRSLSETRGMRRARAIEESNEALYRRLQQRHEQGSAGGQEPQIDDCNRALYEQLLAKERSGKEIRHA